MSTTEKAKGFASEFKQFIARGNVMDMAVGVIIGGAFKSIADSLVSDIINPILGIFTGGSSDLSSLSFSLPGGGNLMLGNFINAVLNFLIMALVVFCIVKTLNTFHDKLAKKQEEEPEEPPEPSNEEKLLTEIRDLLKEK
ncbi:large conductance mechanosensitive channel protein MscL [uncultured Oscillibacter sp.]|uniref:large conductance mechanosensitive channel protein MscL n=1 Tax=uncultured Oscillibacter sp. TaxID=876091 RepID=UPI0025D056FB|nr:large conductance mechanosensitive channel protein MscL [uncultured Oscillibacter sp.]